MSSEDQFAVPGKKVAKMVCVAVGGATKQSNKFYNMYEQGDGTFLARWGRVEGRVDSKVYPMSKWDSTIRDKTQRKTDPYTDVTHLFTESTDTTSDSVDESSQIGVITDLPVRNIITTLQSYANNSVKQNYSISAKSVTQQMVDEAQQVVNNISDLLSTQKDMDIKFLNDKLIHLYHIIPRKMKDVRHHLVAENDKDSKASFIKIIESEQATLDVMAGQVALNANKPAEKQQAAPNILQQLGLEMRVANQDEIANIKRLLGPNANQFRSAYAVVNIATQQRFDKTVNEAANKKTELFWHGSRNQNWLNILSTGLLIRPSGAIHTGSMFGDGIYFADKAQKSIGYTSLRGSYWSKGSDEKAYLALFSVHVGEQLHIKHHDSSCYRLSKKVMIEKKVDSVFAHGGADLRNNEYIVYDGSQSTVSFLVEIGG